MEEQAAPPPLPARFRWRRALAWAVGGLLALIVLVLVSAGGGLWWSLRSEAGTAWLFSRIPGLQITGGKGTLWGDFAADRIEFDLPGNGKLVMSGVGWRGLQVEHTPFTAYRARVVMSELYARRVDVLLADTGKKEPARPPAGLRLPVEVDIGKLRVGELHARPLGDKPLRDLQARLHLGAERGTLHRVDDLALAWDRLKAAGAARIAADPPFALDTRVDLSQNGGAALAWRAQVAASGPLAGPAVQASVRAQPTPGRPEQSADLRAVLRPFEPWPLGDLHATTRALDLSAFSTAAPATALSGEATARTQGMNQPATVQATLANAEAGRWNEGRLPVRSLKAELRARPDDPRALELRGVDAELGTAQQAAGRLQGEGRWTPQEWSIAAQLTRLQPALLDARAAAMLLSGPVTARGSGFGGADWRIDAKAELEGAFAGRGPARSAQLKVDGSAGAQRIELRQAEARAGGARATLAGTATRSAADAPWQLKGQATLVDFDPAPWWPGPEGTPWRKGPNRINAKADVDLALPAAAGPVVDRLAALRGRATASIARSVLAGVPISGDAELRSGPGGALATVKLDAAGNRLSADGRLAAGRQGAGDSWDLVLAAPALDQLAPLWRMGPAQAGEQAIGGTLNASAKVQGRWPQLATQGQLEAQKLRLGRTAVQRAQARWQLDTTRDATVDLQATLSELSFSQALFKGTPPIESAQVLAKGTMRAHTLELRAETKALPPGWTDTFQPRGAVPPAANGASAPAVAARTVAVLVAQGGALSSGRQGPWTGWRGTLRQLELRSTDTRLVPWVSTRDLGLEGQWAGGPARVVVQPGRAEVLGAGLRWSRVAWQAGTAGRPAQIDAQAELEPLPVAPLLARAQPEFGWGGDLAVVGRVNLRSAPAFTADVVFERQRGDLTVTDETGTTQALGLTDLRLGLDVQNGVWSFTQGLAGRTLGVAAGAVVARTSPQSTWPSPDTPIQGVLEVQVANLGTWGPWVPAGWRLAGALRTSASIAGRFGAPEYTGQVRGTGLTVRNFLQGVNVTDGDVAIALQGTTARIERFTARAGSGSATLEGNATLGETPKALLKLSAERFQLLGRVDRRIVTTGQAQLQLDRENLTLDGAFAIDEGLIDFARSDAPRLSDDVVVVRGKPAADAPAPAANGSAAPQRSVRLDLRVALGQNLQLRGRGIDTGLRGELRVTSPANKLALNGTVRAEGGTYQAYGQKLTIERGLITFNGPVENPRLDIEATRPNTDVRVGVLVSGTALNPRVRLFSEPEMSEMDKLSWLVLGRGNEGTLGRTETALLQRAAMALLAGEGGGSDRFTQMIGLDDVSLRQQTDGDARETVIALGKQLSRRWYVGYERSLNATTGTWQLIYRVARRFTLRAQAGEDNAIDVIWSWRWQ